MHIYWIEGSQKCGPGSVPDILAKLQLGELTLDTLAWHTGCSKWAPLRELPAMAEFLPRVEDASEKQLPPIPPTQHNEAPDREPVQEANALHITIPSPLLRFLARMVDTALYATILLGIMYALHVPYHRLLSPGFLLFWAPMLFIEALMLSHSGSTPGKRFLGIAFKPITRPLTFANALRRSVLVFVMGMGCMFVIPSIIMMLISYFSTSRRKLTPWDFRSGSLPYITHYTTYGRLLSAVAFIFLSIILCCLYLQPWVPDMLLELQQEAPDAARLLLENIPHTAPPQG